VTDVAAYARSLDARIAEVLPAAAAAAPGLGARVAAAGMEPADLVDVEAVDRLEVLTKDELATSQHRDPPFGGFLARGAALRRVYQSPGPLYEPEPDVADPWRWAPALRAAGFDDSDLVLNAFSYHLTPAGAMFEQACFALGCAVVPAGVGNLDLQVRLCADLGVTAYVGLPSYLKALLDRAEAQGHDVRDWPLTRAFVSAEPLPPSLRAWLVERVGVVRQGYGTAETGNLGFECEREQGLHVPADALVEVCDLSSGAPLPEDQEGQVVATVLSADYPMVRLGTGDLSAWHTDACSCDVSTPRLRGWLGRVGDAVKVRGMFLHPRQVDGVMAGLDRVAAHRFIVERVDHRDVLRCEVVAANGDDDLGEEVRARLRAGLRFDVEVSVVPAVATGPVITDLRTWE